MPIIGSSAYAQVSTVLQGARACVNDIQGNWASDLVLLPFFNLAYQELWTALENCGQETFISDETFFTVPALNGADPSAQVIVTDTAIVIAQAPESTLAFVNPAAAGPPNTLVPDLLTPLALWERLAGSTEEFVPMADRTGKGGLPSLPQGQFLGYWEWREDGLCFIGATVDREVRMRYGRLLAGATDGTTQVAVRNGINYLTYRTASLGSKARGAAGESQGLGWKAEADESLFQLKNSTARRDQGNSRRRRDRRRGRGIYC